MNVVRRVGFGLLAPVIAVLIAMLATSIVIVAFLASLSES